jgi:hypothetical protein
MKDRYKDIQIRVSLDKEERNILLERLKPELQIRYIGMGTEYRGFALKYALHRKIKEVYINGGTVTLNRTEIKIMDMTCSIVEKPPFTIIGPGHAFVGRSEAQVQRLENENKKMSKLRNRLSDLTLDEKIYQNKVRKGR